MRFQILNKLFFRSDSKSSRVSLSTPGAPLLAATRLYASHTCCLGISNGLTCDVGMFPLFLLGNAPVDRIDSPDWPVPWPHPHRQWAGASQLLRTGPPASVASVLSAFGFCLGTLPLSARWLYKPMNGRRIDTRLLTFRARAADQAHAASTPGTTWPISGSPARLIPGNCEGPLVSMPSHPYDASTATPYRVSPARRFWYVFLLSLIHISEPTR